MDKYKFFNILYVNFLKKIFFRFNPEFVHDRMINLGNLLGKFSISRFFISKIFNYEHQSLHQKIGGIEFKNPVGLSAGFDKNGKLINILGSVGFGFMEIGSVTMERYLGNPKPRLFRLPKSKGLVVYYGLMNDGVRKIVERIKSEYISNNSILGISVAKTNCKETSTEEGGINDYFECLKYLEDQNIGDYYTINVSCPNTFGGEPFTTPEKLSNLLRKISTLKINKPIFVKLPINLNFEEFDSLLKICVEYKITGVVIGNLTKVRDPNLIKDIIPDNIKGGISGLPTQKLTNDLISYTYENYKDQLIIIGVGGIFSAEDAYEKIKRGASILQLITGMIYEGPQLIGQINKGLVELLEKDGYRNISQAIGTSTN